MALSPVGSTEQDHTAEDRDRHDEEHQPIHPPRRSGFVRLGDRFERHSIIVPPAKVDTTPRTSS